MVNTRVKDPIHRSINRKMDRQKRAKLRQSRRAMVAPLDDEAPALVEVHQLKISELKRERELRVQHKESKSPAPSLS